MKHLVSRELYAYWNVLRGARASPERGELDPAAIRAILADTVLIEVTQDHPFEGRTAIIRLSGTRLNALWNGDLKGRSLTSLWHPGDEDAVRDLTALVLDDQIPVVAGAVGEARDGAPTDIEMLLLPLRHHGKTHVRLLGSIVPVQPLPWLGAYALGLLTLTSFRAVAPLSTTGSREAASAFGRHWSAPVRRGRFTVYEGGRQTTRLQVRQIDPGRQL